MGLPNHTECLLLGRNFAYFCDRITPIFDLRGRVIIYKVKRSSGFDKELALKFANFFAGHEIGLVSNERFEKMAKLERELAEKRSVMEGIVKPLTEWGDIIKGGNSSSIVFSSRAKKR